MPSQVIDNFKLTGPDALPDGFVTLAEAQDILGKSKPTIERLVATNRLERRIVRTPGSPQAIRVFPRARLLELFEEEKSKKAARPPSQLVPKPFGGMGDFLSRIAAGIVALVPILEKHVENQRLQLTTPSPVRVPEKLWLSIAEASEYSGLGRKYLRELAMTGKIQALARGAHHGVRINRKGLEDFVG